MHNNIQFTWSFEHFTSICEIRPKFEDRRICELERQIYEN